MLTRFLTIAGLAGALSVFSVSAHAQMGIARATVPFEFAAGGAMLPAGEYTVEIPDLSGVLLLHGSAGNSVALLTTFSGAIPNTTTAKLIFERRDGMAYLSAVEMPDQNARVMSVFKRITKGAVATALR
jgi:hypothetical protein